jgi:hypothetical protein
MLTLVAFASAQTATQSVTLTVASLQLIAVTPSTLAMGITTGVAGTDALTPVTDINSKLSITHNQGAVRKVTASVSPALPSGNTLTIQSAAPLAGSLVTLSTTAGDLTATVAKGAYKDAVLTYVFSANASATALAGPYTVTFTITP